MIRYTITWRDQAQDELASIWLADEDRGAVTAAANQIEVVLKHDADQKGQAITQLLHELTVPPLSVLFHVRQADRMVQIVKVRRLRP